MMRTFFSVLSHLLLLVLFLYNKNNFQECKWLKINKNIFIVWFKLMSILTDATEPLLKIAPYYPISFLKPVSLF